MELRDCDCGEKATHNYDTCGNEIVYCESCSASTELIYLPGSGGDCARQRWNDRDLICRPTMSDNRSMARHSLADKG